MDDDWGWLILFGAFGLVLLLCLKPQQAQTAVPLERKTVLQNEEVWTWVDREGRERTLTVHRRVEQSE